MRAFFVAAAACGAVCLSSIARADDPVIVEYVAPPECASNEAFHALLQAQIARTPNPDRPWRFSVTIRHDGDYVGTLKTEDGVRELRAPKCDDVTAALSLVIAMAQPELPAPDPPPPPPVVMPPPVVTPPPVMLAPPHDVADAKPSHDPIWRLGVRAEHWDDGSTIGFNGAFVTVGTEIQWGFPKMHFEMGVGAMFRSVLVHDNIMPAGGSATPSSSGMLLGLVDAQACPIDLPIASTGFDVLGCGRIAVGLTKGVLSNGDDGFGGWGGGGGRVRWQSPWKFYVQAHFDGLYGTRVEGVPALMDFGGSLGLRI
jgi:hypothetical protein